MGKKIQCLIIVIYCGLLPIWGQMDLSDTTLINIFKRKGIKFTDNNSVVVLPNGKAKFLDLFEAVKQAKSSIHLEYFNFRNDSIANALFELLIQKAQEGVEVRALFDSFGNASNSKPLSERRLDSLRKKGVEIEEFDPIRFPWFNHVLSRDHRKIVIIDGVLAYTGGMNVADYYIKGREDIGEWRDLHFRVMGKVVGELQTIFLNIWNTTTNQNIHGAKYYPGEKKIENLFPTLEQDTSVSKERKIIGVVNREPNESPKIIRKTFLRLIKNAKHTIQFVNPYFTLNASLRKALVKAKERGVDVQVMISAICDVPITPDAVNHTAEYLMRKGIKVYYYYGGFHHTKLMLVDNHIVYTGSANLNSRSLRYDYECNILVFDKALASQLEKTYEKDKATHCELLTPQKWEKMPLKRRFMAWFSHLLEPFL